MKTFLIISLCISMLPGKIFGQSGYGFGKGRIVKKDSSKIDCYVELNIGYGPKVAYKLSEKGKLALMKSSDIKSIETPYRYVENITLDDTERLMPLVVDGQVKLFSYVSNRSSSEKKTIVGAVYLYETTTLYALKKDGIFHVFKIDGIRLSDDFKTRLSELLSDQKAIAERINSPNFKFEDVQGVIGDYNKACKVQALRRQITARVVDSETKKPIRNVKVTIEGTAIGTTTNILGFFQMPIDTINVLLLNHPEYDDARALIPSENSFQIPLKKVRIDTVYSNQQVVQKAAPFGGFALYNKWIYNNNKMLSDPKILGAYYNVVVTGEVDEKGNLSKISVSKGIGVDFDREAMRLILNHPTRRWATGSRDGKPIITNVEIVVDFRMKDRN